MTLLLTRNDCIQLSDTDTLFPLLRDAFRAYSLECTHPAHRWRAALPTNGAAMVLAPGLVPGIPAYTVKVNAKFPNQTAAIRGTILLHDLATGELLAILESSFITALRTGMAGAIAADVLARQDAGKVAIIGAGIQGRYLLQAWASLRLVSQVIVYDTMPERAIAYSLESEWVRRGIEVNIADSVAEAVAEADVIFTATWAREPFLFPAMVKDGVHITTLGPDEPGKCEVAADLIQQGLFFCDDRDLAVSMGAIGGVGLSESVIAAELGEVIGGVHPGRTDDNQITLYGGVGLAWQDLVVAWQIYRKAIETDVGITINFQT